MYFVCLLEAVFLNVPLPNGFDNHLIETLRQLYAILNKDLCH